MTRTPYTVLARNSALGTSRYIGTFDDKITAETYAVSEASRTRTLVAYEACLSGCHPSQESFFFGPYDTSTHFWRST